MSAVNLTNVSVLNNPAPFLSPFQFEISYECLLSLKDDPPDALKIREEDIIGVTVLLLTCSYLGQEFVRVGYYVNNDYEDEHLKEEPPQKVLIDKVQRNILADKPRVTKFPINFHPENESIEQSEQQPNHSPEIENEQEEHQQTVASPQFEELNPVNSEMKSIDGEETGTDLLQDHQPAVVSA
uniref:Anti-silencing function protein 1 n=1 Tax=Lactuca sativa TaxID=4236 RepID=A0A9R1W0L6_LACSA|nr:hypothetical protein LSAT_V11C300123690 [Lactuca sativa]